MVKQCKCGCDSFTVLIDDEVVMVRCEDCNAVYFPDEVVGLPNTSDD